jgi:hypothetical protein
MELAPYCRPGTTFSVFKDSRVKNRSTAQPAKGKATAKENTCNAADPLHAYTTAGGGQGDEFLSNPVQNRRIVELSTDQMDCSSSDESFAENGDSLDALFGWGVAAGACESDSDRAGRFAGSYWLRALVLSLFGELCPQVVWSLRLTCLLLAAIPSWSRPRLDQVCLWPSREQTPTTTPPGCGQGGAGRCPVALGTCPRMTSPWVHRTSSLEVRRAFKRPCVVRLPHLTMIATVRTEDALALIEADDAELVDDHMFSIAEDSPYAKGGHTHGNGSPDDSGGREDSWGGNANSKVLVRALSGRHAGEPFAGAAIQTRRTHPPILHGNLPQTTSPRAFSLASALSLSLLWA